MESALKESLHDKQLLKSEIDKLRRQLGSQNDSKLSFEHELMIVRAKVESQAETIEDLEKIRRQHVVLHEEVNRFRSECYDLVAANKELSRIGENTKEELLRMKELLEQERRNAEEARISSEKIVTKMTRRFDEERLELRDKVSALERENTKLRVGAQSGVEVRQGLNEYNRLRAKQYSKIADRLSVLLEQLKIDDNNNSKAKKLDNHIDNSKNKASTSTMVNSNPSHNDLLERELQKIQRKQAQLDEASYGTGSKKSGNNNNKRWHVKMSD